MSQERRKDDVVIRFLENMERTQKENHEENKARLENVESGLKDVNDFVSKFRFGQRAVLAMCIAIGTILPGIFEGYKLVRDWFRGK